MVDTLHITRHYLRENPNTIFVFGDNLERRGHGGAALLRDEPNTYGFVTKKGPGLKDEDYYTPSDYESMFQHEVLKLRRYIRHHHDKQFIISKVGAGLASRFKIFEAIIEPRLKIELATFNNVTFLW